MLLLRFVNQYTKKFSFLVTAEKSDKLKKNAFRTLQRIRNNCQVKVIH